MAAEVEFGRRMLHSHFPHLAKLGVPMLNTGSFGITPTCVLKRKFDLIEDFESYGDEFMRQRLLGLYSDAVTSAAKMADAPPSRCAIVDNVTFGTTAALQLLAREFDNKAECLVTNWTYGAVDIEADALFPGRVRRMTVQPPVESVGEYVTEFADQLDAHPNIRVAVIDYITSISACLLPVALLIAECRKRNVKVVIDGAHAIGQVKELSVESLKPDFFVGSLTKWLMVPKSAALLYASEDYAERLRPLCISWLFNDEDFRTRHSFIGTRDISSFLAVPEAVRFFEEECGGLSRVHAYCTSLAEAGSLHLTQLWQTDQLSVPAEMRAPYMRMVRLPEHLQVKEVRETLKEQRLFSRAWDFRLNKEKVDVLLLDINDVVYIRVSFAIIVEMQDVRDIGERILGWKVEDIVGE